MKTEKGTGGQKRNAKVRLSNAISMETYKGDLDFLTNKGQADKIGEHMNIAQSEIHRSFYRYTITMDLDQIGIDGDIQIDNAEKARRVNKLLDTIQFLYRDIRGRREDLKPLFIIGGVYDIKNPIFQNEVSVKENKIAVSDDFLPDEMRQETLSGIVKGIFDNETEIRQNWQASAIPHFF